MELFGNDLSLHGQFQDIPAFRQALGSIMSMRKVARRFGREIHCNRAFLNGSPIYGTSMRQAITRLPREEQRSTMAWLTKHGPFWEDVRRHGPDDYLDCGGDIVTDTAIGEAGFRSLHDMHSALVSFTPSNWSFSPIEVVWRREADGLNDQAAQLPNWLNESDLESALGNAEAPMKSWLDLQAVCHNRFPKLRFATDSFDRLAGVPFSASSAIRLRFLLSLLDRRAGAFDTDGTPTADARRIQRDYFSGEKSLFSDSSSSEKRQFRSQLTFRDPYNPNGHIMCSWHGKERHSKLRIHFSWPIRPDVPIYIAYIGPKLTKR